jgi:putative ABC transport system permease protein
MTTLLQDLKYALRTLRKGWAVTSVAVISLALAIGGNATVFSLVDAFLFRPLPYEQPDRVVLLAERQKDQSPNAGVFAMSLATYGDLAERSHTVVTWSAMQPRTLSLRGNDVSEPVAAVAVTPGFFDVMRVHAWRGRTFLPEEGVSGAARVALLGYDYWNVHYGEERRAIGGMITLDGEPTQIVGVLPQGFSFLSPQQDIWVPITESVVSSPREKRTINAVGRMADGATMEGVRREMTALAEQLEGEYPQAMTGWTVDSYNLRTDIPNTQTRVLFLMLQGSVLLVLLIACVNITNLLLARGQTRAREIAVRTVLGAGRGRIVRQLLTESTVMVLLAGTAGIGLGLAGMRLISNHLASNLPPQWSPALDGRVVAFTILVSAIAGLMFGLAPALQTLRNGQAGVLRDGGRGGQNRRRKVVSRGLVIAEIALSFVALGGGSLLVRSFLKLRDSDPGFDTERILTALVTVPAGKFADAERSHLLADRIVERARSLPGVVDATLTNVLPLSFGVPSDSFRVVGVPAESGARAPRTNVVRTTPGYPGTLQVDLLQGRFFDERDREGSAPVVVVNRSLAEAAFAGGQAIGELIEIDGGPRQIVGVIDDVRQSLFQSGSAASNAAVYIPVAQQAEVVRRVMVRVSSDPARLEESLRASLQALDPDLAVSQVLTMDAYIAQFFVGIDVFNSVLGGFGLMALLLASIGTYGVLAYTVNQRRRELGIRMAVGAEPRELVRMIARQGMTLGLVGLAIGVSLTLPLIRVMNGLLQGVTAVQPGTLGLIAAVLFGVTLLASWTPASRAARVDPVRVLRDE